MDARKLKVDEPGIAPFIDEDVLFFVQVVVADTPLVQFGHELFKPFKEVERESLGLVECSTFDPRARERAPLVVRRFLITSGSGELLKLRYAVDSRQHPKCPPLASEQNPRDESRAPHPRSAGNAPHNSPSRPTDQLDAPKYVALQDPFDL